MLVKYSEEWNAINSLVAILRPGAGFNIRDAFDLYFLRYNNPAPGKLFSTYYDKVVKILDNAKTEEE